MTAPTVARFTREEFLRLPGSAPGFRFELLDGELVTTNDPLPLPLPLPAHGAPAGLRAAGRRAAD